MDRGWIGTLTGMGTTIPQISFAIEGGSGTPVPDLSIACAIHEWPGLVGCRPSAFGKLGGNSRQRRFALDGEVDTLSGCC